MLSILKPGGGAAAALRDLLATCKEKHIPARLVLMPEGTPFRRWYGPGANDRLRPFLDRGAAGCDAPRADRARRDDFRCIQYYGSRW